MQEPSDGHRQRRVIVSLGTSILVSFVAAYALNIFMGYTGTINEAGNGLFTGYAAITVAWILFAAFLYSIFSVSILRESARRTIAKVARNSFVAFIPSVALTLLPIKFGGFPFTWRYFYSSMAISLPTIFAVFVAISVFSFEYTRLGSRPSEQPLVVPV